MLIVKLDKFKDEIDNNQLEASKVVREIFDTCDDATSHKNNIDNIALGDIKIEHKSIVSATIDKELYVIYLELED